MAEQTMTLSWIVPPDLETLRVDAFVRRCLPHLSRRRIEAAIRARSFSVGGRTVHKGDRLMSGDKLEFRGPATWVADRPAPESEHEVSVVYEDPAILAMNKPAGLPAHGFSAREGGTLANFLLARWPRLADVGTSRWEPGLVHRIDRDTSGLVLIAKNTAAFADLKSQFRQRQVKKIYWALVWGDPPVEGLITLPLAHERRPRARMRVVRPTERGPKKSWKAITRYRTLGRSRGFTLLEIDMETGVTHQIRAHLAAIGHPIVGDALYGAAGTESFGPKRQFLHAHRLIFRHPDSGVLLRIEAELPDDLAGVLEWLEIKPQSDIILTSFGR